MVSLPVVAVLALCVADGCVKMLVPILEFLDRTSGAAPALLLALPVLYIVNFIFAFFAGIILAYMHVLVAPAAPPADLRRFVALVLTLVCALLLLNAGLLYIFLGASGNR